MPPRDSVDISINHLYYDVFTNSLIANFGLNIPGDYQFHTYRINVAVITGIFDFGNEESELENPKSIQLYQNYPNPFNPLTMIEYALPSAMQVRLDILDVIGRQVKTVVDQIMPAGQHQAVWDASNDASGTYIYRLDANGQVITRRMTLIK